MYFSMALIQSGGIRIAETSFSVLRVTMEGITDNTLKSTFTDSFGNIGTVTINFLEGKIICTVSDFYSNHFLRIMHIYRKLRKTGK